VRREISGTAISSNQTYNSAFEDLSKANSCPFKGLQAETEKRFNAQVSGNFSGVMTPFNPVVLVANRQAWHLQ
jgi:hypothetical protein